MKKLLSTLLSLYFILPGIGLYPGIFSGFQFGPRLSAQDIYVDVSVVGGAMDGSTWADAFDDLQDALAVATNGDVIHVAEGIYYPSTSDVTVSFVMLDGVQILGGYPSGGGTPDERDWRIYETILSGDLNDDDIPGVFYGSIRDDNSEQVVRNDGNGLEQTAVLDGFIIMGGDAYQATIDRGGGIYNNASSPLIINCVIQDNHADSGGGVANTNYAAPVFINTIICGNVAIIGGGALNINYSEASYYNCLVTGNKASTFGGGMYNNNATLLIVNTTISGNYANVAGGGLYNYNKGIPDIRNSIIWRNGDDSGTGTADANVSTIQEAWGNAFFSYSIIQGSRDPWGAWNSDIGVDAGNNLDENPEFFNSINPSSAPSCSGDFRLECESPGVNSGNPGYNDTMEDLAGNDRIYLNIDMGPYETSCGSLEDCVMGSLFVGNDLLDDYPLEDVFSATEVIFSNATIPAPRDITFRAGDSIELLEGFEVEAGAVFTALIELCNYYTKGDDSRK